MDSIKNKQITKPRVTRKRGTRKDPLKVANLIQRTIRTKKAKSYHIVSNVKKPGGRQDKLTPQLRKKLLNAIRSGMQLNRACKLCGVTTAAYYNWIESGRAEADRIRKEVTVLRKEAIDNNELNPWKVDENENWIDNKINELAPNKYFYFLIDVEKHNAMNEMDNLNCINMARDGGEYVSETIIEKDPDGNVIKKIEVKKRLKPNWKAARWMLSKTLPDIYADKQILAHEGELKQTHEHEHQHTVTIDESPDRVAEVLGILISNGLIEGKLIENSEREPKLIEGTHS